MINNGNWHEYSLTKRFLIYKNRIVISNNKELREKLVSLAHDSQLEEHAGVQNSYKRFKMVFY
jgi:hypothetical protein